MKEPLKIWLQADFRLSIGPDVITAEWLRWVQDEAWSWMTSEERIKAKQSERERMIREMENESFI